MKKILFTVALNIVLALSAFATTDIPIAKGHVHDFANKLNQPQKDTLNAMLKMYFKILNTNNVKKTILKKL